MNRSHKVLVTAWGLLALGMLFQLAQGDADHSATDQEAIDGSETASSAPLSADSLAFREATSTLTVDDAIVDVDEGADIEDEESTNVEVLLPAESFVATVTGSGVAAMAEPAQGAVQHWFPNPTQFGGDRTFLVTDQTSSPGWVKVSLPVKPNGQEGWIPRSEVEITAVVHRALVDLSDDSITVWHGEDVIVSTKAVTGKPSTPTPVGTFYVRDIIAQQDQSSFYGPFILALSGFSEVLDTFDGGLPALAIHGTNNPGQIGTERSSGCVRIPNELITLLAESVPLGTPVTVAA